MSRELEFLYDEGADVLYVSLGHPEYTDYAEVNDDLILRFDPETKEIVGFTIIDFLARFSQPESRLRIPLEVSFQPLNVSLGTRAASQEPWSEYEFGEGDYDEYYSS